MFALFDITAKRADLSPHKVAMTSMCDEKNVTYRDLDQNAAKTATFLVDRGVQPGERVAVLCRNCIEFFELLFACGKTGAVLVPLNWRMPAAELYPLLQDCQPKLLFYDAETEELARGIEFTDDNFTGDNKVPLHAGDKALTSLRKNLAPYCGRRIWPADEPWYLLYTSGTTGTPKAVIQTYGMALVNCTNIGQAMDLTSTDTTLNFLPLFHTAGINLLTLPTIITGGTTVVLPTFLCDKTIELLAQGTVSIFFAVPTVYRQLSLHPGFRGAELSKVRRWGCGGAPLPDSDVEIFHQKGVVVCNGYGMTETGPTVFLMDQEHAHTKVGSVGKPQILADIRIVDHSGRDVAPGETGELWISGPGVTPGYWNKPKATREAFTADGWLKTGDLARQDKDGYCFISGRLKDMYISGGENVYPVEVENILNQHDAVLDAAVLSVPDETWGEVGHACIKLKPGIKQPDIGDLECFCREYLAAYKIPKTFQFVENFPRTAAGKIRKHLIKVHL